MTTILAHAPAMAHSKLHHPENSSRIANIIKTLDEFGILEDLTILKPRSASKKQIGRVHNRGLIDFVKSVSKQGGGLLDRGDTYCTAESYKLAKLAVGGSCMVLDKIMEGKATNGFALVRPPGHHAERDHISGFCIFNNIAAAARHAQVKHNAKRVVILDFDVHHGNGTQDIFYEDDTVLFISLHLFAPYFYPGIGSFHEIGTRIGRGYTINVPFPPGVADRGYLRILKQFIRPVIGRYAPDVMLVSVGFDAHWRDPLAMAGLSLSGYASFTRELISIAENFCKGRILFVLEGGYQQEVLEYGIANVFTALLGKDKIFDPFGPMNGDERDISRLLTQLESRDLPF
ncbi:MAG: histone deacetylase [Candidatus Promineifilaceae bacterium]|nr:histone deacetylase [Candidatus Promineifilaceae bacterium]